jgi:hypothetical protein
MPKEMRDLQCGSNRGCRSTDNKVGGVRMLRSCVSCLLILSSACAAKNVSDAPATAAKAAPRNETDSGRCQRAATLREDGYKALSALKLAQARRAYAQSLELDPFNRGARHQLEIIEALSEDRQVGTSADNDSIYGVAERSPCERYVVEKRDATKVSPTKVATPVVTTQGQIVTYTKGSAEPHELLSSREADDVFRPAITEMTRCYARGLQEHPALRGEIMAQVDVEPNGAVAEVQLQSNTLYEPRVESCIADVMGKMHFPKRRSHATMKVRVPLVFGSTEDDNIAAAPGSRDTRAAR